MKTLHRARGIVHDLVVTQEGNTITLWSGPGIRHTVIDLNTPHRPGLEYARNMLLALAFNPQPRSFLILGLGGGAIPRMLRSACRGAAIEAVEVDPAVPDIARRFFRLGDLLHLDIHNEDAAEYVARCGRTYGCVILDAYIGDVIPQQCRTREFCDSIRERLSADGVLAVNLMGTDLKRYTDLLENLEASQAQVWLLRGGRSRNMLVFASPRRRRRAELLVSAGQLSGELPVDLGLEHLARRLQLWHRPAARTQSP
jgi:hypothetical protein